MKHYLLAVALICFCSTAYASVLDLPMYRPTLIAQTVPTLPPSLATVSGTASTPSTTYGGVGLGGGWMLSLNTLTQMAENPLTAVNRDFYPNGMWEIGFGVEAAPITNTSSNGVTREVAFLGITNTYVSNENGAGLVGLNLGVHMPTLVLQAYQEIASKPDILSQLPPWVQKLNQYTSLDVGGGYRPFGVPAGLQSSGIKAYAVTFGFYCNIPVDTLIGVVGSL